MIIDIMQSIVNYVGICDQVNCIMINKFHSKNIYIFNVDASDNSIFGSNINQNIIEQHKYSKLKILNCRDNEQIEDVNHLADTLENLDCSGNCAIDQNGISKLDKLKRLIVKSNRKINNINHLTNVLEELHFDGTDKYINRKVLSKFQKVKILNIFGNDNIADLNFLSDTLEELSLMYCQGIDQNG